MLTEPQVLGCSVICKQENGSWDGVALLSISCRQDGNEFPDSPFEEFVLATSHRGLGPRVFQEPRAPIEFFTWWCLSGLLQQGYAVSASLLPCSRLVIGKCDHHSQIASCKQPVNRTSRGSSGISSPPKVVNSRGQSVKVNSGEEIHLSSLN